VTDRATRV